MYLDLHITKRCNLRCKHCYLTDREKAEGQEMPFELFSDVTDNYFSLDHPIPSSRKVLLSGGEPTMHPDVDKFIWYINNKHGINMGLLSNGYRVKELLQQGAIPHPNRVQISIDGDKETHDKIRGKGSFDTAVEALRELVSRGRRTHIFFTLNQQNKHTLPEVKRLAQDIGVDVYLNYYHSVDDNKRDLGMLPRQEFIEYLEANGNEYKCYLGNCVAGVMGCMVMPDGTYYDCSRNMNQLGKYPQKIEDVLLTGKGYRNPYSTCMKRTLNHDFGCLI